ncbi:MAG: glucose 1-dehydrogenase [Actinobacteria bacterium]|jgi:gluconate 5-dehydrogenase|nr:MAG: glucose 1-dehydrogenase [Actinomycetota bacterium]
MQVEEIKNLFDLSGRVAVITGGSGGLGRAAAAGLATYGASVVITARRVEALEEAAAAIRHGGGEVLPVSCDVTDGKNVEAMVERTLRELGRIDILLTAAGIARRAPAEELGMEDWDLVMDTNVKGTFLCCQEAGRVMISQGGGKIITVSSVRAILGHPLGYAAYGTSKGAINLLTRQLAVEWAKHKINVNSIAPCIFRTPLTEPVLSDPESAKVFLDRIPWGRAAEPEDFIGSAVFLASAASDFITGQILYVDGGNAAS